MTELDGNSGKENLMLVTFIAATATSSTSGQVSPGSSVIWMILQVFFVFCITLAGLVWLSKHKI